MDQLTSIGAPETTAGEQAKSEVDDFADTTKSSIDTIKTEAESLQGSSLAAFTAGVASIATELNTIVETGAKTLTNVEQLDPTGELKDAVESDKTCQSLTGGS